MALDGITSFLSSKDVTITCKHMQQCSNIVKLLAGLFTAMAEMWKKPKPSNVFLSFIVC